MPSRLHDERSIAHAAAQLQAVAQALEVLALTPDEVLLATLREAVGTQHPLVHARTRDEAATHLMSGRVSVIIIDTLAAPGDTAEFCDQLRAQFPDLVLLVSGGTDEQTQLVKQITSGDIYRFLHKPVSPPRARQFVEAAVRRHMEGRTFTPEETAASAPRNSKRMYIVAALAAVILAAVATAAYVLMNAGDPAPPIESAQSTAPGEATLPPAPVTTPVPAPEQASTVPPEVGTQAEAAPGVTAPSAPAPDEKTVLLAQAGELMDAGQLVAPARPNAQQVYAAALELDPANAEAQAGLDEIAKRLLDRAEAALLEARIDDAARDIDSARQVRPDNARLAFLSAQLVKERERHYITLARQAAEKGDHARARALLARATDDETAPSAVLTEVRKELERRRVGDSVEEMLRLANERLKQEKLFEPADDSARTYIEAALKADPTSVEARQARLALADRLLVRARQAVGRREVATAERFLSQAQSMGADSSQLRTAERELQAMKQVVQRSNEIARLSGLLQQSLDARRFVQPERDSAQFYWKELRALDNRHASLQPALHVLGEQMVELGRTAFAAGNIDETESLLASLREMNYAGEGAAALERDVAESRKRAAFLLDVVPVTQLERVRQPSPRYPPSAERQGIEGEVDVEFTVSLDGSVKDIVVTSATPPRVFEDAATRAVAQWQFRPVLKDGRAAEQRARVLLKFELPD